MSNLNSIDQQLQNLKDMRNYLIEIKHYSEEIEVAYLILLEQLCNEWAVIQWRKMQQEYYCDNLINNQ